MGRFLVFLRNDGNLLTGSSLKDLYGHYSTILEINMQYATRGLRNMSDDSEVALDFLQPNDEEVINKAVDLVVGIMKDFKKSYPMGVIYIDAMGLGCEVSMRTLEKDIPQISSVTMWYPSIVSLKNVDRISQLRDKGHIQEKFSIIANPQDSTVPLLNKIKMQSKDKVNIFLKEG